MTMKLLSADDFRSAAKDGDKPEGTVFRFATAEPETVEGVERTKRFVFSDATVDHAGDSIDPKGWDLSVFKRNPVALFSHMSWEPPIGRASNVKVEGGKLVGDIEFASADVYEFADTIFRLVDAKFMNAVSVGFKPVKWAFTNDKDRPYGIDFQKQLLLEISVCPVPCNPNALSEARSIGIDTAPLRDWAEKVLDSGEIVFLPKSEVETLRLKAGAPERRFYMSVSGTVPPDAAEQARDAVKRWENDPAEVLALPEGITLRSIADGAVLDLAPFVDPAAPEAKAGRRISAATRAKLGEAMTHHEAMGACIKSLMDYGDDNEPDDDPDDLDPEGNVVLESHDPDAGLSPEELRIKEARELRESLPNFD